MYPVDLHVHTVASTHAYSTIDEYVRQARKIGVRLLAVTDHGPALHDAPSLWHFVNLRVIPHVLDGVGVLRGIEANILESGLDCPDDTLATLDIVLAGFHMPSQTSLGKEGNTRLMVDAICGGKVHVITHPGNPLFPVDAGAVAEAASRRHVALEVNNASFMYTRKGSAETCLELIAAQRDAGGWIAVDSDAHHSTSLGSSEEALKIVRAVNFPEERILNASPERTLEFLEAFHGKRFDELRALFAEQS